MIIKVTPDHVIDGTRSTLSCPYALAIIDACPNLKGKVRVYNNSIRIMEDETSVKNYSLPANVKDWIMTFDMFYREMDKSRLERWLRNPPDLELPLEKYCG